jgi:hypothetical protein
MLGGYMSKSKLDFARDFLGNKVSIGDRVIFGDTRYQNVQVGTVVKITPCKFSLEYYYKNQVAQGISTCLKDHGYVCLYIGQMPDIFPKDFKCNGDKDE